MVFTSFQHTTSSFRTKILKEESQSETLSHKDGHNRHYTEEVQKKLSKLIFMGKKTQSLTYTKILIIFTQLKGCAALFKHLTLRLLYSSQSPFSIPIPYIPTDHGPTDHPSPTFTDLPPLVSKEML